MTEHERRVQDGNEEAIPKVEAAGDDADEVRNGDPSSQMKGEAPTMSSKE